MALTNMDLLTKITHGPKDNEKNSQNSLGPDQETGNNSRMSASYQHCHLGTMNKAAGQHAQCTL